VRSSVFRRSLLAFTRVLRCATNASERSRAHAGSIRSAQFIRPGRSRPACKRSTRSSTRPCASIPLSNEADREARCNAKRGFTFARFLARDDLPFRFPLRDGLRVHHGSLLPSRSCTSTRVLAMLLGASKGVANEELEMKSWRECSARVRYIYIYIYIYMYV